MIQEDADKQAQIQGAVQPTKNLIDTVKTGDAQTIVNFVQRMGDDMMASLDQLDLLSAQKEKFGIASLEGAEVEKKQRIQKHLLNREVYLHKINTACIVLATLLWGFGSLFTS